MTLASGYRHGKLAKLSAGGSYKISRLYHGCKLLGEPEERNCKCAFFSYGYAVSRRSWETLRLNKGEVTLDEDLSFLIPPNPVYCTRCLLVLLVCAPCVRLVCSPTEIGNNTLDTHMAMVCSIFIKSIEVATTHLRLLQDAAAPLCDPPHTRTAQKLAASAWVKPSYSCMWLRLYMHWFMDVTKQEYALWGFVCTYHHPQISTFIGLYYFWKLTSCRGHIYEREPQLKNQSFLLPVFIPVPL